MKIDKALFAHLNSILPGRLRLKLFEKLTGKPAVLPTKKQGIQFIESLEDNFVMAELCAYIFTDGNFSPINNNDLKNPPDIRELFKLLNAYPLSNPLLFSVTNLTGTEVGVWVTCNQLQEDNEYFYRILLVEEAGFPDEIINWIEVRTSQLCPEPAFVFIENNETTTASVNAEAVQTNEAIIFSLRILHYVATKYTKGFTAMEKVLSSGENPPLSDKHAPPEDEQLTLLLKQLGAKEIPAFIAEVDTSEIIPHNYDFCFQIPFLLIQQFQQMLEQVAKNGMVVYWNGEHFVMSDDYLSYLVLRKNEVKKVKVIIIGDKFPAHINVLKKGGFELLPSLYIAPSDGYDGLPLALKDAILSKYLKALNTIDRLSTTLNAKCIVFTEDLDTSYLENLLASSGFYIDDVMIYSYKNCTHIESVEAIAQHLKKINPSVQLIVHRDRDYLPDAEVEEMKKKIIAMGTLPFITRGTDIESYFIDASHIHALYTVLSISRIEELISEARTATKEVSLQHIKKNDFGDRYQKKKTHLDAFLETMYEQNTTRYSLGKKTMGILTALLQKELHINPAINKPSVFLIDDTLKSYASAIWPDIKSWEGTKVETKQTPTEI